MNTKETKSKKAPKNSNPFCNKTTIRDFIWKLIVEKSKTDNEFQKLSNLYKRVDLTRTNWSHYTSGESVPNSINIRKLILALKCTVEEANRLMHICGYCFIPGCEYDDCLKECLKKKIYKKVDVDFYISQHSHFFDQAA